MKPKLERIRRFFAKQVIDYAPFSLKMVVKVFKKVAMIDLILDSNVPNFVAVKARLIYGES
ncbi:hypothetical protein [Candidatus Finniella inopinata]|uniref:Uncharacterized protein n=1 Tax=Candidatus Finniella inopinata TaxID=1696036 RepID=A0A4Q7DF49_9PROT|nr:hypothetical protein [Candidatus Finniella inopinata]RZI45262.1 hypothetical protein EQU50_07670 [Candidatus Finniella inopinata]